MKEKEKNKEDKIIVQVVIGIKSLNNPIVTQLVDSISRSHRYADAEIYVDTNATTDSSFVKIVYVPDKVEYAPSGKGKNKRRTLEGKPIIIKRIPIDDRIYNTASAYNRIPEVIFDKNKQANKDNESIIFVLPDFSGESDMSMMLACGPVYGKESK